MLTTGPFQNRVTVKRPSILVALLLVIVTAVTYGPVLKNDFAYYDDESYITANTHIQKGLTWKGLTWAFTSAGYSDNWHPLTWLSHMLDVQLFGLNPAGHHFMNLVLHILAMLLLLGFLISTTGLLWPSALVAALFALHPLHVESVAWAAERKDVLSAVFWFAALWAYAQYVRSPTIKKYALVFVLFALGLMAKPMLVTLPVALFLLDYWPLQRIGVNGRALWQLAMEKIPLFILTIASSIITIAAQHGAIGSLRQYTLLTRISNAIISYCVYCGQTFWPNALSVMYTFILPRPMQTIMCALVFIVITAVVVWQSKTRKYLITGWLWYVVSLLPVIGIIQVGSQPHADRYTYIPLIGIFVMVTWGLQAIAGKLTTFKKQLAIVVIVAVLISMAIKTREQIGYWKNGITLFSHCLEVTKGRVNENAYYNFGNCLMEAGRTDEAIVNYKKALDLNPNHARSHINLGLLLSNGGQYEEAKMHYLKALQNSADPEAHNNLGTLLARMGKTDEAQVHFLQAMAIDPGYADAHYNFGFMLSTIGRNDEAIVQYQKALEINPRDEGIHVNLGILLGNLGRIDEAIAHFRAALQLQPDAILPLQNLAIAYAQKGRWADADSILQTALASAKSSGNDARAQAIARSLSDINITKNVQKLQ